MTDSDHVHLPQTNDTDAAMPHSQAPNWLLETGFARTVHLPSDSYSKNATKDPRTPA
jgi:hypothetical protein